MGTERARSIEQAIKGNLVVSLWESINQEGAYVDMRTGTLHRLYPEALAPGHSPVVEIEGRNSGPFARISDDPNVPRETALLICKTYNVCWERTMPDTRPPDHITAPLAVGKDQMVAVCRWCKGMLLCPTCGRPLLAATFDNDTFGFLCPHCMEQHAEPLDP